MDMKANNHWFLNQEFKWRSIASAVWTWCISFLVLAGFIFVFSIHPSRHIFIIYDFLTILSSFENWAICIILATITCLLVRLHFQYYQVAPIASLNRFKHIGKILKPRTLFHNLQCGVFSLVVAQLFSTLVPGRYSLSYAQCSYAAINGSSEFCINEFWFIFVFYGLIVGIFHSAESNANHKYSLQYLHVQEARFLFIKCKLPSIISNCVVKNWNYLRRFLIAYYLVGFISRDVGALALGVYPSESYLLSIWSIYEVIPVGWSLCVLGTLVLLLQELSWQLFNIYNTQNFNFMFDSVFPEDQSKLLVENLNESKPPVVQHLAFQCLSLIAKQNPSKRQQIFALSHKTENGRPVWWNKILDACLSRIQQLTFDIAEYQTSASDMASEWQVGRSSSSSSERSDESKLEGSPGSASVLRHRQMADYSTCQPDVTNMSHMNVSSLNTTSTPSMSFAQRNNASNITVPTPRLWTMYENNATDSDNVSSMNTTRLPETLQMGKMRKKLGYFIQNIKTLSIVAYFFKTIPSWALQNLYREHCIIKWSMQSLSYLCSASVHEDKFGVVQARLNDVVSSLVELLVAIEKLGKVSPLMTKVHKLHISLHNETKSSIHRIVDAYGDSLWSVNLSPEHRKRLEAFYYYNE